MVFDKNHKNSVVFSAKFLFFRQNFLSNSLVDLKEEIKNIRRVFGPCWVSDRIFT
jgi:hypothetical protein